MLIVVVFFHACGYMMPYIFLPGKVLQMGFSKERAAWLISAIGIAETCSRLLSGVIGSIFRKQVLHLYDFNAGTLSQNTHKAHHIARPEGRIMGHLLLVHTLAALGYMQ